MKKEVFVAKCWNCPDKRTSHTVIMWMKDFIQAKCNKCDRQDFFERKKFEKKVKNER